MKRTKLLKCAFLLAATCMLHGCGKEEINLNDYIVCSYEGYDRLGEATCEIDYASMVEDHFGGFKLKKNYNGSDKADVVFKLGEKLSGGLDQTEGLRNNDVLSFTWNNPDKIKELEKIYNVKLIYSDTQFTVSDLTELIEVNPFDYSVVSYDGLDGEAYPITVQLSEDDEINVYFAFSKDAGVSNGDELIVSVKFCNINGKTINEPTMKNIAKRGYYFTETERTVTVEGLSHYAKSISEIPTDALNAKVEEIKISLNNYFTRSRGSVSCTADNVELAGLYLLSQKPDKDPRDHNLLYYVFKIDVTHNMSGMPSTVYFGGNTNNLVINADGTCSELKWMNTIDCNYTHPTYVESWNDSIESFEQKAFRGNKFDLYDVDKILY